MQELLGHSTIATIADTYSHVSSEMRGEVVNKMDDFLDDHNKSGKHKSLISGFDNLRYREAPALLHTGSTSNLYGVAEFQSSSYWLR